MKRLVLLALVSCGAPPRAPVRAPAAVAPSTCADAGAVLRGPLAVEAAGPSREAAIRDACAQGRWSIEVLDCITGTQTPDACLADLPPRAHAAYDQAIADWRADHSDAERAPDEAAPVDGNAADALSLAPECADVAATIADALMPVHHDARFANAMRREAVQRACEDDAWSPGARACLAKDPILCAELPAPAAAHLAAAEAAADARLTAIDRAFFAEHLLAPTCERAVQAHYTSAKKAAWRAANPRIPAADQRRILAESARAMLDACTTERWGGGARMCLVAADDDSCFAGAVAWPLPALTVLAPTGIEACDYYARAVVRIAACRALGPARRREFLQSLAAVRESIATTGASGAQLVADACRGAHATLDSAAPLLGCGP